MALQNKVKVGHVMEEGAKVDFDRLIATTCYFRKMDSPDFSTFTAIEAQSIAINTNSFKFSGILSFLK